MTERCQGTCVFAHVNKVKMYARIGIPAGKWSICEFCVANGCAEGLNIAQVFNCQQMCSHVVLSCDCRRNHIRASYGRCNKCDTTGAPTYCEGCHVHMNTGDKFCIYCAFLANVCPCGKPI